MTQIYTITIPPETSDDMSNQMWTRGWRHSIAWCDQHVGEQSKVWWYKGLGRFEFAREQDRTMFLLRWGS